MIELTCDYCTRTRNLTPAQAQAWTTSHGIACLACQAFWPDCERNLLPAPPACGFKSTNDTLNTVPLSPAAPFCDFGKRGGIPATATFGQVFDKR